MSRHIVAILWKQIKDTLKNKTILIQFMMFPALTIIMENAIQLEGMPEHFFATLFAVMYLGMAPLTSMAAIISEEKERNTLRVLLMSNVSPKAYLLGIGLYIWLICMMGACVIGLAGHYEGEALRDFMIIMGIGNVVSILIGAVIGAASESQMKATSLSVPIMMIFAFLPMLAMFNEGIEKVAKFTYTQQINILMNQVGDVELHTENVVLIGINVLVAVFLFAIAYKRSGLE